MRIHEVVRMVATGFLFGLLLSSKVTTGASEQLRQGETTLYPCIRERERLGPSEYGRSAFSFEFEERSDTRPGEARNDFEVLYGSISFNGDVDWFLVQTVTDDRSRIRDLGVVQWHELGELPTLTPNDVSYGVTLSKNETELETVSHGTVAKARQGHIYLVRTKDSNSDLASVMRVDRLVPGRECTISWRVIEYSPTVRGPAAN